MGLFDLFGKDPKTKTERTAHFGFDDNLENICLIYNVDHG